MSNEEMQVPAQPIGEAPGSPDALAQADNTPPDGNAAAHAEELIQNADAPSVDGVVKSQSDETAAQESVTPQKEAAGESEDELPKNDDAGDPNGEPVTSSKPKARFTDYVHPVSLALFAVAGISGILLIAFYNSREFADFFNERISSVFRFLLAKITDPLPFSLAETVIFSLPIFVIAVIVRTVRLSKLSAAKNCRFILGLLSILSLLFSLFVLNFASAYRGSTIEQKLGLERKNVSADELAGTAIALHDRLEKILDEVQFGYGSFSVMPYSLSEMNDKLNDAYETVCEKYPFVQSMRTKVKLIVMSEPMTYTHISGVYSYFTGEANLNVNFPDYMLPYTAAHELAHQRGIAREDEANFMAFLVCIESDDPYIRYSGYANVLSYVLSSLYSADPAAYINIWKSMDRRIVTEYVSYSEFFEKYRESKVSKVSDTINDTYLKIQGQSEGSRSYGRVVDLTVAYAKAHFGVAESAG